MNASVTKITPEECGLVTVELEWSGKDQTINDFDLSTWMEVRSTGGDLRKGWVVGYNLDGLDVGDTVCADEPSEITSVSARVFGELPGSVEVAIRDHGTVRVPLTDGMVTDHFEPNAKAFEHIERSLLALGHKSVIWAC